MPGDNNSGIVLAATGASITTIDGPISFDGTGQGSADRNYGAAIFGGSTVRSTGTGNISMTGANLGGTSFNVGVLVEGLGNTFESNDGDITLVGTSAGTNTSNFGVGIVELTLESVGTGSVSVTGTTADGASDNGGVRIGASASTTSVQSAGGGITITGTGVGQGDSVVTNGVQINEATVSDLSGGAISITGTGADGTLGNRGVLLLSVWCRPTVGTSRSTERGGGSDVVSEGIFVNGTSAVSGGPPTTSLSSGPPAMPQRPRSQLDAAGNDLNIDGDNVRLQATTGGIHTDSGLIIGSVISANTIIVDGALVVGDDDPLTGPQTGVFQVSGDLVLSDADAVTLEISGTTPGTDQDQISVSGSVDLGNAALNLSGSIASNLGQVVTIISNDSASPVVGTFAGLPRGGQHGLQWLDL